MILEDEFIIYIYICIIGNIVYRIKSCNNDKALQRRRISYLLLLLYFAATRST